jgi:sirohydrochlorin cobaltochelatase
MTDRGALDVALAQLERRLDVLLPDLYRQTYQDLRPIPMRSAALVYDTHGRVAWDRMWESFCDLAMAGGPPHKGRWLAPASPVEVAVAPDRYDEVVEEIRRGVGLATGLDVRPSRDPGWVPVACYGETMAEWLTRAVVMENVAARRRGSTIELPASPAFRIEKEIRNVVTVMAKTCHYWMGHIPPPQQYEIRQLLETMEAETPTVSPPDLDGDDAGSAATALTAAIALGTARVATPSAAAGWVGVACASAGEAIWMMRALVASNVHARREDAVLLVPVNPVADPDGLLVTARVTNVHRLANHVAARLAL